MKKRLIYIMTFLLCGTFLFSSCEDILKVDSNRVEYEFDDWTLNDSVYSVLGILKAVQEVGDRQVLINELRGDLVTVNEAKAVVDVQELSRSVFNLETNKYLDVKDYYAIINNCNIYLARVDTTLEKNNIKLMLPEYVAVKSVRAWTYLQLAINYNNVPYFTEPILTHSAAEDVMNKPMLTRDEIINKLIADIIPYENPAAYPMPAWDKDGKVLKFGYGDNGTEVETKRLFVPIRMLLGELYLWKGDYKNAARFFYAQIAGTGTNETAKKYTDYGHKASYSGEGGKNMNNGFMGLFSAKSFDSNSANIFTIIPFANTDLHGTTSGLAAIFSPPSEVGAAQVVASPGIQSLSKRQIYRYYEGEDPKAPELVEYSHFYEYPGDLRIKATTYSQRGNDEAKTEYKNIIGKFNFEEGNIGLESEFTSKIRTTFVILQRKEHAYLRLAEAMVGLEREGYVGAMDLAMTILKVGAKSNYQLLKNPVYAIDTTFVEHKDTLDQVIKVDTICKKYLASCTDSLRYNFGAEDFRENKGIHSRGCGDSERNVYYALTDSCIARYMGLTEVEGKVETITRPITYQDSLNYIADLVIDELALELAWEGTRFGDLIRFAKAMGDNDVLAKRVAGRAFENDVTYRSAEFQLDAELYGKMSDESNWYLPLPGDVVQPVDPEDVPAGELPE
ncbi:MAG: hypothetical protein IKY73_08385 [Bacteroidaceae bacterium]|nr:hypothetical protein [Bacteroidaceae bacterium]